MLSEERIEDIADASGHATVISYGRPAKREVIWYDGDMTPFARAIESAATAPLLARIAELERQLAEVRLKSTVDASEFNRAIDFAIDQGSEAMHFLTAWREGDTADWPEFAAAIKEQT